MSSKQTNGGKLRGQEPIGIVLQHGDRRLRKELASLISTVNQVDLLAEFTTRKSMLDSAVATKAGVLIVDSRIAPRNRADVVRALRHRFPETALVAVIEPLGVVDCRDSGCLGFHGLLPIPIEASQLFLLVKCALEAFRREQWLRRGNCYRRRTARSNCPEFSGLESNVVEGLSRGWIYQEIGETLGYSPGYVHKTVSAMLKALELRNRTELVHQWLCCVSCRGSYDNSTEKNFFKKVLRSKTGFGRG